MRIVRLRIDRFGRLTDREMRFDGGMTIIHGSNESGKTTMMEFIRSALVPTSQRNVYPKRARTDSGTVVIDDDGTEKVVVLEGRARKGEVPGCISDMDPAVYRTVFAMDQSGLDSVDVISSGDIRSRFLMLPGGESMPMLISEALKDADNVLGRSIRSNTTLSSVEAEIESVSMRISELRSQVDRYGALALQKDELTRRVRSLEGGNVALDDCRIMVALYEANSRNYEELSSLESALSSIGPGRTVTDREMEEYTELRALSQASAGDFSECFQRCEAIRSSMGGADPEDVMSIVDELEQLPFLLPGHRKGRVGDCSRAGQPRPRRSKGLMVAGAALTLAGFVGSMLSIYAIALVPAGLVAMLMGSKKKSSAEEDDMHADSPFERQVHEYMARFGIRSEGLETDVRRLTALARDARRYSECSERCLSMRRAASEASRKLTIFLDRFGGKDAFEECMHRAVEVRELERSIEALRRSLASAGLDPDVRSCPVSVEDDGTVSDASSLGVEIGRLESEMEAIMQSDELESLMDRREALMSRRDRLLKDGAEAMLRRRISEMACDSAYSANGAGVVATADRYLSMMTCGRYRMENDPRESGITIRDSDGSKGLDACSTGLRAQVLLSLKLAVAREMGGGKVPMILDDVLLPFDTDRKEGAMRALKDISEEMQIIMFTCDDAIAGMCPKGSLVRL